MAIGGWISIPFVPVPLTLQTLIVLLAGGVMGRYAVFPALLYLGMGACNLPVFHNGTAGIGVLLGPTGGYLLGFVPAALITGLAFEKPQALRQAAGLAAGLVAVYACGLSWLVFSTGLSFPAAFLVGAVPFIPGEVLKAPIAFTISRRLQRLRRGPLEEAPASSAPGD
jgi:biotin transport system substrate-specific component